VRLLVPFPPGGSTEFAAKTMAGQLEKVLGQSFVIEHKLGTTGSRRYANWLLPMRTRC